MKAAVAKEFHVDVMDQAEISGLDGPKGEPYVH